MINHPNRPDSFILPNDAEEARKILFGVVVDCSGGEEWYYYNDPVLKAKMENQLPDDSPSSPGKK
jgi:hypothetical protein